MTETSHIHAVIEAWHQKQISSCMAVMELLLSTGDAGETGRILRSQIGADGKNRSQELLDLLEADREASARAARVARRVRSHFATGASVVERVASMQRLFDGCVADSEEASVALYSLGKPDMLDAATDEIVDAMRVRGMARPSARLLQIGCGIGRFEIALAPHVREAFGIDVSRGMVEAARRRAAGLSNVRFEVCSGLDLAMFDDGVFDVVYAFDSIPYLVEAGMELVETHFREAARVLSPRGQFVIFGFSYRGPIELDRCDVRELAADHDFRVVVDGDAPFELWNGHLFHLERGA
jgi:SAM-dependent methyltransferase